MTQIKESAVGKKSLFSELDGLNIHFTPTILLDAQGRFESEVVVHEEPLRWMANVTEDAIITTVVREPRVHIIVREATPAETDEAGNPLSEALPEVSIDSIAALYVASFYVTLGARLAQVRGEKSRFSKTNFEYLSVFGPFVAAYGIYHDANEAYDLVPVWDKQTKATLIKLGCLDKKGFFSVPEWYPEAMRFFRRFHLFTNYGLPKETTIEDPSIFKLTVKDGNVIGRADVGQNFIFISALVHSSKLSDLFGAYRTLYCGIKTLRTSYEQLALKALHALTDGK